MTTPAQNVSQSRAVSAEWRVTNHTTGASGSGTVMSTCNIRRFVRPASSNNPIRPDKTRRPANWNATWKRAAPLMGSSGMDKASSSQNVTSVCRGAVVQDTHVPPPPSVGDRLLDNVRLKALAKATESQKQLNAALAQARGTVGLAGQFSRAASSRLNAMMDGKRGLFKKLGRMSGWKELPSEYLAYLYGLAPLGDDLANGLNKLAWMRVKGFRMSMVLKSSQTRRESIFQVGGVIQNGTGGFFNPSTLQQRWNGSREITAKVGYRFDLPAWFLDNSPTLAPFSTAYELAPYSFVLDWFLPVGNWLGALESAQYSPFFKEGFEQVFVRDRYDYRGFGFQNRTANMAFLRLESGYQEYGFLRRQLQTVPPSVITTLPALNPLPGLHQAAQGLALLTQAFKRWR